MKYFPVVMLLFLTFVCGARQVRANMDDLRPLLKKAELFVKTQLPQQKTELSGGWKVFRTFTSTRTKVDICWEGKKNNDETLSLQIEVFPDKSKAERKFIELERFLTFEETETTTIHISDFGDTGFYSYIKRFPKYLDHIIDLNFRMERFVVQINAPSDKTARIFARFVETEINNIVKQEAEVDHSVLSKIGR